MKPRKHILIGDCQVKPGVPTDHLDDIAALINDQKPDVVVCIGDFWDFPSLSSYDKGTKSFEGRRYHDDVTVGNEAFARLTDIATKGLRNKPRMVFTCGNHEQRIERAVESARELEDTIGYPDLAVKACGWEFVPFLKPVTIDGVQYCHFFPQSAKGSVSQNKRGAPSADAQLQRIGMSCSAGHQQGLSVANRPIGGRMQWGIICGSTYQHAESYLTPQGNTYFRGVVVKEDVQKGNYSPRFIDLDFLKRTYRKPAATTAPRPKRSRR